MAVEKEQSPEKKGTPISQSDTIKGQAFKTAQVTGVGEAILQNPANETECGESMGVATTDIMFSISLFILVFFASLFLNHIGKSWNGYLRIFWQLCILFFLSASAMLSLTFIFQGASELLTSTLTARNKKYKTMTGEA